MADGDEKEQQLREEIASQKAAMADLPSLTKIIKETDIASPETIARAQLIKELSDSEEQLELLMESKRVNAVIRLQDELHPPLDSEDCPICLETIKHVNSYTCVRFYCCGNFVCRQCADEREAKAKKDGADTMLRNKCPLCRETMFVVANDCKKARAKVLEHANRGMAWALSKLGVWYSNETEGKKYGFPLDKEKGLHFLKQGADQRYSDALLKMAMLFFPSERDESKHIYHLKEAADLGNSFAQEQLSDAYKRQNDDKGHLHYATLAASQGDPLAFGYLGSLFMRGACGLAKSLILGKHYSSKSLEFGESPSAYNFSAASLTLTYERYERFVTIPGHSPIPKILFWLPKALKDEVLNDTGKEFLLDLEYTEKSHCANCWKKTECSSFMRCSRCSGAWYCGKECQVQHWKAGHKLDCIKKK